MNTFAVRRIRTASKNAPGSSRISLSRIFDADEAASRCHALPFTMMFWAVFMITQVGHRQVRLQQSMQQSLWKTLSSTAPITTASSPACDNSSRLLVASGSSSASSSSPVRNILGPGAQGLQGVIAMDQVLKWVSQSLVPQVWAVGPQGKGVLHEFTRALGGVRIKQTQLGQGGCAEGSTLNRAYNLTCFKRRMDVEEVKRSVKRWLPGVDVDDEGALRVWLDLSAQEEEVRAQLDELWDDEYLSAGTQSVWVQSVFINAQVSLLAFAEVHFFLDRAGRLASTSTVFTLPTEVYGEDWLVWLGDMVLLLMVFGLVAVEALLFWDAKRRGETEKWCNKMRVLNWGMVILGTGFSLFFGYLARELSVLSDELGLIPDAPGATRSSSAETAGLWAERRAALDAAYDEVARLSNLLRWCELSTFWYSLLVLMKFFAVFEGSPRLAVITETLRRSSTDMLHFLVVFIVVFFTYALGAYFLFGHQLKEWANIFVALNSSFRALMGDFSFSDMYAIAPLSALVWFWSFMILIFLVMLNMLLAIVLDTYSSVKDALQDQVTLWHQMGDLKRVWTSNVSRMTMSFPLTGSFDRPASPPPKGMPDVSNVPDAEEGLHRREEEEEEQPVGVRPTGSVATVTGSVATMTPIATPQRVPSAQQIWELELPLKVQQVLQQRDRRQQVAHAAASSVAARRPRNLEPLRLDGDKEGRKPGTPSPVPPLGLVRLPKRPPSLETPKWFSSAKHKEQQKPPAPPMLQ